MLYYTHRCSKCCPCTSEQRLNLEIQASVAFSSIRGQQLRILFMISSDLQIFRFSSDHLVVFKFVSSDGYFKPMLVNLFYNCTPF